MSGNQDQLAILVGGNNRENGSGLGYKVNYHPIKTINDSLIPVDSLVEATSGEAEELEEEHGNFLERMDQASKVLKPHKDWFMELADFLVMLKILQEKLAPKFSIEGTVFSVNGQFNGDFDSIKEKTINIQDGRPDKNLKAIYTELMSLMKYFNIELQGELYVKVTNLKLALNREARFFQLEPDMNEADIIDKNNHVFRCLRMLRSALLDSNGLNSTLQPWITDFFVDEILDWRHSDLAFGILQNKIKLFKEELKNQISWSLTNKQPTDSSILTMKMMMAGIPTINDSDRKPKPLQISPYNASLARDTIFWV